MNGFRKLQERLREEGWLVEWNMPCCQSRALGELPYKHEVGPFKVKEVDFSKVLFNHSQDCEIDSEGEDCSSCDGDGMIDNPDYDPDDGDAEQYIDCDYCGGEGILYGSFDDIDYEPDVSVSGFACMPPEVAGSSMFCFDGDKQGVKNLKEILPIIEECGCKYFWSGKGNSRIDISW